MTIRLTIEEVESKVVSSWGFPAHTKVWGVPRGGWPIAYILKAQNLAVIVDSPDKADVIVDDIIDSGATREKYNDHVFWTPYVSNGEWVIFPWEKENKDDDARELITRCLQHIGENPKREGLLDTPARVVKSWKELYAGYTQSAEKVLSKVFESDCDEMVICKDIEFYSMCEHHILPFTGKVHIGYLPNGKVVGLSKLARCVEVFARRLQIQEQLTVQIANSIQDALGCKGVGVVVEAKHHCMCSRGVGKQNSVMKTSALLGMYKEHPVRQEFLKLIHG